MQLRFVEILVGFFMLFGLVSLLVLALKVSGLNDFYAYRDSYAITADFENVAGLKPRSKVTIAGVSIGRVQSITYAADNYSARVTMLIFKDVNNIPEDSRASILTAGFLGDNYVGISPGFSEEMLKENSHIDLEQTNSGVILEELISKFVSGAASQ